MSAWLPEKKEEVIGLVGSARSTASPHRNIAGCMVLDVWSSATQVRLLRNNVVQWTGHLESLPLQGRRQGSQVGLRLGLTLRGNNDIQVGDQLEVFEIKKSRVRCKAASVSFYLYEPSQVQSHPRPSAVDQIQKDSGRDHPTRDRHDPRWTDHALGSGAVDRLRAREGVFHGPGRRARGRDRLAEREGRLHSQLYKLLHIHTVPTLRFFHDEQIARGIEMSILIDRKNWSGPIRACLTNLKTSPDRAVVAASTFRIPTMAKRRGLALDGAVARQTCGFVEQSARAKRTVDAAKAVTPAADPFATGLCAVGRAIKTGAMLNADKTYRATLQFGEETDSGDLTGNVVATAAPGFSVTEQALRDALSRFFGHDRADSAHVLGAQATASCCTVCAAGYRAGAAAARSRFIASSCCPCPGRRRSMSHAVKACIRTLAQDIGRALCPPGGAGARTSGRFRWTAPSRWTPCRPCQTPSRHCLH